MLGGCARDPGGSASGTPPYFFTLFSDDCVQSVWLLSIGVELAPTGVNCPSSTFTGKLSASIPEDHDQHCPPVDVLDESTRTGSTTVSSFDLLASGPEPARPPAAVPRVVFCAPLLPALGLHCPVPAHGPHRPLIPPAGQLPTLSPKDYDQPFPPIGTLDESTNTGAIHVSSSDSSVPGLGSARPPADAPGVVHGAPLSQAIGVPGPASTHGAHCPLTPPAGQLSPVFPEDHTSTGPGSARPLWMCQGWWLVHPHYKPLVSIVQLSLTAPIAPCPPLLDNCLPYSQKITTNHSFLWVPWMSPPPPVQPLRLLQIFRPLVLGLPTPLRMGNLDEPTTTGAIPVSSSDFLVPDPGSARPPADAPGVVFGAPPLQSIGTIVPEDHTLADGAHSCASWPAAPGPQDPEYGCARPPADGPEAVPGDAGHSGPTLPGLAWPTFGGEAPEPVFSSLLTAEDRLPAVPTPLPQAPARHPRLSPSGAPPIPPTHEEAPL